MASTLFHVHHEFRAGKAQQWWKTAQAAMAAGGGWNEAVANNLKAGFYNHACCPIGAEGPAYCIWEVREGISADAFREFIDGPNGVNFRLGVWMNICKESNLELAGVRQQFMAQHRPSPLRHEQPLSPAALSISIGGLGNDLADGYNISSR